MTDFGSKFGTRTAMTCTLTSLGSGNARESTVVDETSSLAVDEIISVEANGSAAGNTGLVDIYVYVEAGASAYTDGATGSDAAFTAANRKNSRYLGSLLMNGTTGVKGGGWSVAEAFGGVLPRKWGLIFINNSGASLSSTGGDFSVYRQPVYGTTA